MADPITQGRWTAEMPGGLYGNAISVEGDDFEGDEDMGMYVLFRSRQDCEDLIALLERVRERL